MDIYMFGVHVKSTGFSKCNSGLIVAVNGGGSREQAEDFLNKSVKPHSFFCSMHGSDILGLSPRKSD